VYDTTRTSLVPGTLQSSITELIAHWHGISHQSRVVPAIITIYLLLLIVFDENWTWSQNRKYEFHNFKIRLACTDSLHQSLMASHIL